jgi:hypothetical protein
LEEIPGKQFDVLGTLSQRRYLDSVSGETVVEVGAECIALTFR